MKKLLSVLLAVCMCCGLLVGCGEKKVKTTDFDSETNKKVNLKGYSFEIPKSWEEGENTEDLLYYYPEDAMLMVGYSEMEDSINDTDVRKEFLDSFGAGMEKCKITSESEIEVNEEKAYQQKMSIQLDGKKYTTTMVVFDCSGGVIFFVLSTLQNSDKDYANDFQKIVESISKLLPFARTIDDMDNLLTNLNLAGKCDFSSTEFGEVSDTPLKTWIDSENGTLITVTGNENKQVTLVYAAAKDEQGFISVCIMALMGVDVLSTNASEYLTNLSPENLQEMESGADGAELEVIDGVTYLMKKMDNETYKYSFMLQRDKETEEDYESYLQYRELMGN